HKPVRIAQPLNISGSIEKVNSPNYSTAVGLLHYGKELYVNTQNKNKENSFFEKWIEKITNWFKKEF
ncbi:MAG: cell division protein FtsA, partial [Buchnera aphidicola]|nr:cell division protein FtsA [Buchnera aphidicola]